MEDELILNSTLLPSTNCSECDNSLATSGNCTDGFMEDGSSCTESEVGVLVFSNPEDFRYPWISNQHFYPNILTYLVTMMFGIIGNVAFIAVMAGDRKARTTTNVFLVSLSVADLLMLTVCAPLEIVRLFVVLLNFGGAACKMGHYFMMLSFTASVLNLTAVSLERLIVIVYPMKSRSLCTMSNCRRSVLFVWAVSLLLACPIIWVMEEESIIYTNPRRTNRVVAYYCRDVDTMLFPTYRLLVLFCIPAILMIAFYTIVSRELWKSTKNIYVLTNSASHSERLVKSESYPNSSNDRLSRSCRCESCLHCQTTPSTPEGCPPNSGIVYSMSKQCCQYPHERYQNRNLKVPGCSVRFQVPSPIHRKPKGKGDDVKKARKQVIKMLIVIVLLFVLCWGPTLFTEMLIGLGRQPFTQEFYVFKWVSSLLPFVHCCINPIIYCCMSKNFRKSMLKVLFKPWVSCRNRCQSEPHDNVNIGPNSISRMTSSYSPEMPTAQTDLECSRI